MPSTTLSFAFDVCLLFIAIFGISRLIHLRSKRESIMRRHKPGTASYNSANKALSTRTLAIIIAITVLVIAKTVFDIQAVVRVHGESALGHLLFLTAFVGIVFFVVLYAVHNTLQGKGE